MDRIRAILERTRSRRSSVIRAALLLSFLLTPPLLANSGTLSGRITNGEGDALAEVEVLLEGRKETLLIRSDTEGRFQLRDLVPGNYSLVAMQDGYCRATYRPVHIRMGRTTHVAVLMSASVDETVVVTSEPPAPAVVGGTSRVLLSSDELGEIPTASDPWTAAAATAGVLRSEGRAGARGLTVVTPGADQRQNGFAVDGEVIAAEPPPTYDVEQIVEVQVASGGADARTAGSGALFNLVTRRAHNAWRGAVRLGFADHAWQSEPALSGPPSAADGGDFQTSRLLMYSDHSGDVGGRLIRDRLWAWGSVGGQQVERQAVGGLSDRIDLHHSAAKLQSRLKANSAVLSHFAAEREQIGLGAGPDRSLESLLYDRAPSRHLRLEDSHVIAPGWVAVGSWSSLERQARSRPLGAAGGETVLDEDGIWYGSFGDFASVRETESWRLQSTFDRPLGPLRQEIHLGASHAGTTSGTSERWGTDSLLHLAGENFGTPFDLVRITRPSALQVAHDDVAFWLQDSMQIRAFTADVGLRYEIQRGRNLAGQAEANPLFPELLPALEYSGDGSSFVWNSVSPRLGLAWTIGGNARTVLRASYASFASRLHPELVSRVNPLAAAQITLGFEDLDQDRRLDAEDPYFIVDHRGVDVGLTSFSTLLSPNRVDPTLRPERTDEMRFSAEHRFRSEVRLGLDVQARQLSNILELRRFIRGVDGRARLARSYDYLLETVYSGVLPGGEAYAVPVYSLRPGLEYTGGNLLANGDRKQHYESLTLRLDRPMVDRWMLRAHLTWNDWRWQLGDAFRSFDDPTDLADQRSVDGGVSLADSDGDIVAAQPLGGGSGLFLNSRWALNLLSVYRVAPNRRWGFQLATNVHAREGYPVPYTVSVVSSDQSVRTLQVTPRSDSFRLEDVYTLDLRLEKGVRFGRTRATLSVEGFNVLNGGYVLERERQLNSPQADRVRQTLSPRTFKVGLRIGLE